MKILLVLFVFFLLFLTLFSLILRGTGNHSSNYEHWEDYQKQRQQNIFPLCGLWKRSLLYSSWRGHRRIRDGSKCNQKGTWDKVFTSEGRTKMVEEWISAQVWRWKLRQWAATSFLSSSSSLKHFWANSPVQESSFSGETQAPLKQRPKGLGLSLPVTLNFF